MKIAIDVLPGLGTGVGRWQRETVRALAANVEDRVTVFAYQKRCPRLDWIPVAARYRQNWLPGSIQRILVDRLRFPIETVCGLGNPDAVLCLSLHHLLARAPVMLGVADVSWRRFGKQYRTTFGDDQIERAETAIRGADHLLTLSKFSADELVRGGAPSSKVTVAYLGVGEEFRKVGEADAVRVQATYQLPDEFVLYVGGINERKNIAVLKRALEQITPSPPLIIVGPWPAESLAFWELDRPWIRHLGYVPDADIPGILKAATMMVFPSKLEGFGLPLVEAMAVGTPVIASDIPVFREIGGAAAVFFQPDVPDELAQIVRTFLGSAPLRSEYKDRGLAHVVGFTWEAYGAVLNSALRAMSQR